MQQIKYAGFTPFTGILKRLAAVIAAASLTTACCAATMIDIAFVGAPDTSAYKGVQQGLNEGNLQGQFLNINYQLVGLTDSARPRAIIAAVDPSRLQRLVASHPTVPIINVSATGDPLRAACYENLFHTIPSQRMFSDATAQWLQANPDSNASARTWHYTFKKYAASQLNMRFSEAFTIKMDDEAWAGWAATKLLTDTLVRSPELADTALLRELKTNVAFDGQKGIDMDFRETGQLRQPLLLVDGQKIVGEAPVRGVVDITALDSLGVSNCPK